MLRRPLKIRHYIAAIVAGCSLGGLALSSGLAFYHRTIEDHERMLQGHSRTLRQLESLQQLVDSWGATTRLAIYADPASLQEADAQVQKMLHHLENIRADTLAAENAAELDTIGRTINVIQQGNRIASSVPTQDPSRASQRLELTIGMQTLASRLSTSIDLVEGGMRSGLEMLTQDLRDRQSRLWRIAWIGGLGYLTLVLLLWRWTMRRLIIPLQVLTEESRTSVDVMASLRVVPDGPLEVRQLTDSLAALITRLLNSHEELEERIQERTEELERANQAKNDFLANMSHEIRTPMTAIMGYAELCQDRKTKVADRQRYLDVITANGQHLLSIINDILDISKIEAGRMSVEQAEASPFDIVAEVTTLMEGPARERGVELRVESEGAIPEIVLTDATRLRQILLNLVGNAIKFTDEGEVSLEVSTVPRADDSGELMQFQIRDTGVGLSAEEVEQIFKPFVQADTSARRAYGGTGLGLSISRVLATLLGGSLICESEKDVGSCFTVTIDPGPLYGVRRSEFPGPRLSEGSPGPRLEPGPVPVLGGRALLAEDVAVNRRLVAMILESAGMAVDQAENGAEAVDMVLEQTKDGSFPYDIIFMDMQMPVMDGYEATRKLRDEGFEGPIVALTAHAMSEERTRCIAAGCTDYATKPIDKLALLKVASQVLRGPGSRKDTAGPRFSGTG